jgi:exosome complex component RRP42
MAYKITKKSLASILESGNRFDSRGLFEQRDIKVKFGISNKAEASVSVKIGKTEVICGVKMSVSEPYTDHEKEGTLSTSMELLPLSSPSFEYGPPSPESIEIARVIDRGIRESGFIEFEKLCIKEGEKVWCINLDLAVLNDDGNLIDAGAIGAILALMTAKKPVYDEKEDKIEFGKFTEEGLPLNEKKMPLTITFFKIGDKLFIDPTREEEDISEGRLTVEMSHPDKEERINAMQKGGEAPLSLEDINIIMDEGVKIFKKLKLFIEKELKEAKK